MRLIRHHRFFPSSFFRNFLAPRYSKRGKFVAVIRNERCTNPSTRSVSWRWGKKRIVSRFITKRRKNELVEARQKDGKRSPVKRPGAPVSVDTALVEYNARPGRLSLTITVCYLVQLKHPLSLSSFFPQPLPLLRCFFVQRDAHGRARKVH